MSNAFRPFRRTFSRRITVQINRYYILENDTEIEQHVKREYINTWCVCVTHNLNDTMFAQLVHALNSF